MSEILRIDRFNRDQVRFGIMQYGAAAVPLICEEFRLRLVEACHGLTSYRGGPDRSWIIEPLRNFSEEAFIYLAKDLEKLVNTSYGPDIRPSPEEDFTFNSCAVIKYKPGSHLEPHFDGESCHILTCVAVVDGWGQFRTYPHAQYVNGHAKFEEQDRHEVGGAPGDVIFMREQGFAGIPARVCHEVAELRTARFSVAYRYSKPIPH